MLILIVLIVFVPAVFAFPLIMCWVEERLYQVTPVRAALPPLVPAPGPVVAARRDDARKAATGKGTVSPLPSHRRSRIPRLRNRRAAA
jgi:hypothetical protein